MVLEIPTAGSTWRADSRIQRRCMSPIEFAHPTGFPASFTERAFERFSRADTALGRGGVGLGLAIVDAIARAHDGAAGAGNRAQGGGNVWITLPRLPIDASATVPQAESQKAALVQVPSP